MYVSMNWIKEYISIPQSVTIEEIVDKLTKASVEVDGVNRIGEWWEPELIQVGLVKDILPHPNADRLRLADIELAKSKVERVVCGAPNLEIGQKIVFAKTGSKVFSPKTNDYITLEAAKIRGVESNGMVLSESELGISDNHEGILVLDNDYEVGTSAQSILADTILDVHIWPNRPDLMNIVGIAREIDAIFNAKSTLKLPDMTYNIDNDNNLNFPKIEIDNYDLCSRYTGMLIKDVTIGESPSWLQDKLRSAGMRPIYNVVDITNYVMMEMGQPLHSFDYDKLNGTIKVRNAKKGEQLVTLDDETRELATTDLVIADDKTAIALAGVMGGANSDITDNTKNVFLEAANFNPNNIRRTSQKFDLRSEASARFERNLPPHLAYLGIQRAAKLIQDICGGTVIHELADVNNGISDKRHTVKMNIKTVQRICGIDVSEKEVLEKLQLLGFELDSKKGDDLIISVPLWRTDITIIDDLIEEFIRIYGYDKVPSISINGKIPDHDLQDIIRVKSRLQDLFVAQGFNEIISYSLTTVEKLKIILGEQAVDDNPPIALKNTLSSERKVLRTSMRHSLLETISYNIHNGQSNIWIFESGRIYSERRDDIVGTFKDSPLAEQEYIVGAVSAQTLDRFGLPTNKAVDFFDVKGALEAIFTSIKVNPSFTSSNHIGLTTPTTDILVNDDTIGVLGTVNRSVLDQFDIAGDVILFELQIDAITNALSGINHFKAFSKFPAVVNDLAVIVDENISHNSLIEVFQESALVHNVQLFDIYRGDQIDDNKKSLAYKITYQSFDKTLTNEEVTQEQNKIIKQLNKNYGATIRE
tara:strand:+ start:24565 stop:27009 length:2445 start_codon:yes stop_codon:yes gene_type:complete